MVKYSCEKCGKEFTQKGHYTKHTTKKNPCVFESKFEEMIEKVVAKKINEINTPEVILNEEMPENIVENIKFIDINRRTNIEIILLFIMCYLLFKNTIFDKFRF